MQATTSVHLSCHPFKKLSLLGFPGRPGGGKSATRATTKSPLPDFFGSRPASRALGTYREAPLAAMASPIGYLIHPDPSSQPQKPASQSLPSISNAPLPAPETHSPLAVTSSPASSASTRVPTPSLATSLPDQQRPRNLPGDHNRTLPLYQCADCLRKFTCHYSLLFSLFLRKRKIIYSNRGGEQEPS